MGQLVVQEFVTADGFAANTNNEFTAYEMLEGGTKEFDRSQLAWLDTVDAMVLGSATYRMFVEFWPTPASAGEVIAPALNGLRRFVFSRSLRNAPWGDLPRQPSNPAMPSRRSAGSRARSRAPLCCGAA